MLEFILMVIITTISLLIISRLPIGIIIESWEKALIAGLVFGLLNAFVRPFLGFFASIFNFLTLGLLAGLVSFILNVIIFGLAAWLVKGFALKNGVISAILGALALSILNSIIAYVIS